MDNIRGVKNIVCFTYFLSLSDFPDKHMPSSKWEVVCYNVADWKKLAQRLSGSQSRREEVLHQLITENFLPNLPKIVEDMVGSIFIRMLNVSLL